MEPTVSTIADLFASIHDLLRKKVKGVSEDELNWSPGPETNSVAELVTHLLGSELDTLNFLRNIPAERDREAEFRVTGVRADTLLAALDRADSLLQEYAERITAQELDAIRSRPGRDPKPGRWWLVNNYGHAREHLGHIELTRQLYQFQRNQAESGADR